MRPIGMDKYRKTITVRRCFGFRFSVMPSEDAEKNKLFFLSRMSSAVSQIQKQCMQDTYNLISIESIVYKIVVHIDRYHSLFLIIILRSGPYTFYASTYQKSLISRCFFRWVFRCSFIRCTTFETIVVSFALIPEQNRTKKRMQDTGWTLSRQLHWDFTLESQTIFRNNWNSNSKMKLMRTNLISYLNE